MKSSYQILSDESPVVETSSHHRVHLGGEISMARGAYSLSASVPEPSGRSLRSLAQARYGAASPPCSPRTLVTGAPGRTRTCNILIRSQILRGKNSSFIRFFTCCNQLQRREWHQKWYQFSTWVLYFLTVSIGPVSDSEVQAPARLPA